MINKKIDNKYSCNDMRIKVRLNNCNKIKETYKSKE